VECDTDILADFLARILARKSRVIRDMAKQIKHSSRLLRSIQEEKMDGPENLLQLG